MVFGYMFRPHCGHLQANVYIEGTLSVQVDLKITAVRPKHVAKNHYVVALNIVSFIIVVCDIKYICLKCFWVEKQKQIVTHLSKKKA